MWPLLMSFFFSFADVRFAAVVVSIRLDLELMWLGYVSLFYYLRYEDNMKTIDGMQ